MDPAGVRLEFAPLLPQGNLACESFLGRWQILPGEFGERYFPILSALVQSLVPGTKHFQVQSIRELFTQNMNVIPNSYDFVEHER